jgi:NADH-quinone oxidoreductase subunit E
VSATPVVLDAAADLEFPPEAEAQVREVLTHYPNARSAVLPILWIAQNTWGWLPPAALRLVARTLGLPEPEVFGIATFYTMFHLKPVGRHHLQLCMTLSCSLMGADRLYRHLQGKLAISHGEVTPDGRFSLQRVECLAACGGGPCMQVGMAYHENLDEQKLDALLETLK